MLERNLDDCKLDYVKPEQDADGNIFAKNSKADIDQNVQQWCNTLFGYVIGDMPYYVH